MCERNHDEGMSSRVPCYRTHLPLRPGYQNSDTMSCESSDSLRSICSLTSPLDVEMVECGEAAELESPILSGLHGGGAPKSSAVCHEKPAALSSDPQIAWNSNVTFLNANLANQNRFLEFDDAGCTEMSPHHSPHCSLNEAEERQADARDQGPSEAPRDSVMSVSSGDMVMRRSSLSLDESDKQLSVSLLAQSISSSTSALELGLSSMTPPHVCEGLLDKTHVHNDVETWTQQENQDGRLLGRGIKPSVEKCPIEMPHENGDCSEGRLRVFDAGEGTSLAVAGITFSNLSEVTPSETFIVSESEISDSSCNAQTSTPVQGSCNKVFCIPSSESLSQITHTGPGSPALGAKGLQRGMPFKPHGSSRTVGLAESKMAAPDSRRLPKLPEVKSVKAKMPLRPSGCNPVKPASVGSGPSLKKQPPISQAPANQNRAGGPDRAKRRRSSSLSKALPAKSDEAPATKTKREACSSPLHATKPLIPSRSLRKESERADVEQEGAPIAKNQEHGASAASGDGASSGRRWSPCRLKAAPARSLRLPHPSPPRVRPQPGGASVRDRKGATAGPHLSVGGAVPPAGVPKMRLTERPCVPLGTPGAGPARPVSSSRLPVKGPLKSPSSSSLTSNHSTSGEPSQPARASSPLSAKGLPDERPCRPKPGAKSQLGRALPGRSVATAPACRVASGPSALPPRVPSSPVPRNTSARPQRSPLTVPVDRNRSRPVPRSPRARSQPDPLSTQRKVPGPSRTQQLHQRLGSLHRVLDALAVVVQHVSAQREEALKQREELSVELLNLRQKLGISASLCERLQQEKEDVRVALEGVLQKVREQHERELAEQKRQLQEFFSAQCEEQNKTHQEALDCYKTLIKEQIETMSSKHEAQRSEMAAKYAELLEKQSQEYQALLDEHRRTHKQDVETLGEQVQCLSLENEALNEKLKAEEDRSRILAEKNQKDSHTSYLEQELQSLKVVLDMKNQQLHQQEKKLLQMDKLVEDNVKLEESLKKVQHENEEFQFRMDKHAALSRQLSTEQAALQQILQKESNMNKRLSMENEELLWKLQNGDLSSPRRLSPSSPLQSPSSSMFTPR